jgi:hypothetical protein
VRIERENPKNGREITKGKSFIGMEIRSERRLNKRERERRRKRARDDLGFGWLDCVRARFVGTRGGLLIYSSREYI